MPFIQICENLRWNRTIINKVLLLEKILVQGNCKLRLIPPTLGQLGRYNNHFPSL